MTGAPLRDLRRLVGGAVRDTASHARARFGRRGVVLLYHRVAELERDPWELAVSPARFDAHVAMLRRRFHALPLAELAEAVRAHRPLPRRAVAITFDDAYGDNARAALPVLERHRVPATLFAVSGMVGSAREFWWDELERLVLDSGPFPPMLALADDLQTRHLAVPAEARAPLPRGRDERRWRAMDAAQPTARHALYFTLWQLLQPLTAATRARALRALEAQVGAHAEPRGDYLPCSDEELRAFAASPVGTVGAHTVSHPELAGLEPGEQEREITGSRAALEALLDRPVTLFSYPFGQQRSLTPHTRRLVREAGFQAACVNWAGAVDADADPLRLPRVYVTDCDAEALCARLEALFGEP